MGCGVNLASRSGEVASSEKATALPSRPTKDTDSEAPSIISRIAGVATPILTVGSYLQYANYVPGLSSLVNTDGLVQVGKACSNASNITDAVSSTPTESSYFSKACSYFGTAVKVMEVAAPFLPEAAGLAFAAANPIIGAMSTALWVGSTAFSFYNCIKG